MQKQPRLITGVLILNSILAGVTVFALFCALGLISLVVDQEVGQLSVTEITQWVFDYTPRHPFTVASVSVAVTATCLFLSLAFPVGEERAQRTTLHSLFFATFCLLALTYFFLSITGIGMSLVHVYGCLYVTGQPRTHVHAHESQHLHWSSIDARIWLLVAGLYSLALLVLGIRIRRRAEAINSVQPTAGRSAASGG